MSVAFIQGTFIDGTASGVTSLSKSFSSNNTTGNTIIVGIGMFAGQSGQNTLGATPVSDTQGNTYSLLAGPVNWVNKAIWLYTASGIAGGANTVTAHFAASSAYCELAISEYSGFPANILDVATTASNSGSATLTVGPLTTLTANDVLLIYANSANGNGSTPPTGFTNRMSFSFGSWFTDNLTLESIGSYSATLNNGGSFPATNNIGVIMVALHTASLITTPTVTISAATNINTTSVTLNGAITASGIGGNATVEGFNYGLTTAYGSTVFYSGSFGVGSFSYPITGLIPFTTYHVQAFANNPSGSGVSSDIAVQTYSSGGEVSFTGTVIGTPGSLGSNGNTISNLFDANELTWWDAPDASGDWAGINAGAATTLTRVRLSPRGAYEDLTIGGAIQASNSSGSGYQTLVTIATRPNTGMLLNEYNIPFSGEYQYYRYLSAPGAGGEIADLEFVGYYSPGVIASADRVTFSPPGRIHNLPLRVHLSSLTSGAAIYYTLDGSTPSTSSTLYSVPIVVGSGNITISAIATLPSLSNSRVTSQLYQIGGQIVSTNISTDTNRGYPVNAVNPNFLWDPVSSKWFCYGESYDMVSVYENFIGVTCYSSVDFRNWHFEGNALAPAPGAAIGSNQIYDRPHVLYNSANNNYVLWARATTGVTYGPVVCFTSPSPTGPFTLANTFSSIRGYTTGGDLKLWMEPDGTAAYLFWSNWGNQQISVDKLNSTWTAVDGINYYTSINNGSGPFGYAAEGHGICKYGSTYFWMTNVSNSWAADLNLYITSSSPLGPWSSPSNPFQSATIPQTPQEAAVGVTASPSNAYDSQVVGLINISGRNAVIYMGDRYSVNIGGSQSSTVAMGLSYRLIRLPVEFTDSTHFTISWSNAWNLDSVLPTLNGEGPSPAI